MKKILTLIISIFLLSSCFNNTGYLYAQLSLEIHELNKTLPQNVSDFVVLNSAEFNGNTIEYKYKILSINKYDLIYDEDFFKLFLLDIKNDYNIPDTVDNVDDLCIFLGHEEKKMVLQELQAMDDLKKVLKKIKSVNLHYFYYDNDNVLLYDFIIKPNDL